jgi:hypothetical protein
LLIDAFTFPPIPRVSPPSRFVTSSTAESLSPYFAGKPPERRVISEIVSGLNIETKP